MQKLDQILNWEWWWKWIQHAGTMTFEALFIVVLAAWLAIKIRVKVIERIFELTKMDEKKRQHSPHCC